MRCYQKLCYTNQAEISLHGQAVKTSPSHGGIWGSIPHGGTKTEYKGAPRALFSCSNFGHLRHCKLPRFLTRKPAICTLLLGSFSSVFPYQRTHLALFFRVRASVIYVIVNSLAISFESTLSTPFSSVFPHPNTYSALFSYPTFGHLRRCKLPHFHTRKNALDPFRRTAFPFTTFFRYNNKYPLAKRAVFVSQERSPRSTGTPLLIPPHAGCGLRLLPIILWVAL